MTRYVEDGYFGGQEESMLLPALYGGEAADVRDDLSTMVRCYTAMEGRTEAEFYERLIAHVRAQLVYSKPGRSFFSNGSIALELELPTAVNELPADALELEEELEAIIKAANDGAEALGMSKGLNSTIGLLLATLRTLGQMLEAAWWGDRLPVTTPSEYVNRWMNEAMDALERLDGPGPKAFEHVRRMRLYDELAAYTDRFNDDQHALMEELESAPLDQPMDADAFLGRIAAVADDPEEYGW